MNEDEIKRPDLAIYSQNEVIAAGGQPTWDSPDITTNDWRPFRLMPEARVKVRNLSPNAAAANALVHYYISRFGIGAPRELKATRRISLAPGAETELLFPLEQAVLNGDPRVGVFIEIEHRHDTKKINNSGAQVHQGDYTSEVGRNHAISFPVVNNSSFTRQIALQVLPTNLTASVTPNSFSLAPLQEVTATLNISVPATIVGSPGNEINEAVTVIGVLAGGGLLGGLTRLLRIDT
ncbi:MAG: hypothetical protein AAFW81_00820 [Pseudomonadota bacterium]